jgi:hypothetical protein
MANGLHSFEQLGKYRTQQHKVSEAKTQAITTRTTTRGKVIVYSASINLARHKSTETNPKSVFIASTAPHTNPALEAHAQKYLHPALVSSLLPTRRQLLCPAANDRSRSRTDSHPHHAHASPKAARRANKPPTLDNRE